jgi:hypothetical protein
MVDERLLAERRSRDAQFAEDYAELRRIAQTRYDYLAELLDDPAIKDLIAWAWYRGRRRQLSAGSSAR